jgi:hypothetical protein
MTDQITFSASLLQWIRKNKTRLAELAKPASDNNSGLSFSLIQTLFRFERSWRGRAPSLRSLELVPRVFDSGALRQLQHDISCVLSRMRESNLYEDVMGAELLMLPAPTLKESVRAEWLFYYDSAVKHLHKIESRPHQMSLNGAGSAFVCVLSTNLGPKRGHGTFKSASLEIQRAQGESIQDWLKATALNWRKLQATLYAWSKDDTLWPTPADATAIELERIKKKLYFYFSANELSLLRSNMSII